MENSKTKFRPILFSTPMVQAILEGRKTMTRRTKGLEEINKNPNDWKHFHTTPDGKYFNFKHIDHATMETKDGYRMIKIPYQVGDVLWVRETFSAGCIENGKHTGIRFKADDINYPVKWKPSLFMPKEACRIFLRIKSIRVERLQDISEEDIKNEGVQLRVDRNGHVLFELGEKCSALFFAKNISIMSQYEIWKTHWAALWCKINGVESWKANPFVWVYEFEQIEKPLDFI